VVTTKHAVNDAAITALLSGVVLNDDPEPVAAAACERVSDCVIHMTLTEGKYHQVKRMLAAVGNRVEALHRAQMGGLALDADLAERQWRWLTASDLALISGPKRSV
jgi:16S rRNA pseudouridine516 synthase